MNRLLIQGINLEDLPHKFRDKLELPRNGGNVTYVDKDSEFGEWLIKQGFEFQKSWIHLVVFR